MATFRLREAFLRNGDYLRGPAEPVPVAAVAAGGGGPLRRKCPYCTKSFFYLYDAIDHIRGTHPKRVVPEAWLALDNRPVPRDTRRDDELLLLI